MLTYHTDTKIHLVAPPRMQFPRGTFSQAEHLLFLYFKLTLRERNEVIKQNTQDSRVIGTRIQPPLLPCAAVNAVTAHCPSSDKLEPERLEQQG